MVEQLLQLLRFASETVPDPRLPCAAMQAQNVIDSANTVEDKGTGEALAQLNLRFEGCELEIVGCGAKAVKATFADKRTVGAFSRIREKLFLQHLQFQCQPIGSRKMPRMQPVGRDCTLVSTQGTMGMKVEIRNN